MLFTVFCQLVLVQVVLRIFEIEFAQPEESYNANFRNNLTKNSRPFFGHPY